MDPRHRLGGLGEERAVQFYRKLGAKIVAKNWRHGRAEIDLIVILNGTLAFVEVKTRSSNSFGSGFDAVGPGKQRTLERAARAFLAMHRDLAQAYQPRFDVLSITTHETKGLVVEHIPNAWEVQ